MSITEEKLRDEVIILMIGFMEDVLYKGSDVPKEDIVDTAAVYYDVVTSMQKEVKRKLEDDEAIAAALQKTGLVDASNPTQVDLVGGPRAIDESTVYKG
jgi:hypothetical protein